MGVSDPEKADQILNEMVPLAKDYKTRFQALAAEAEYLASSTFQSNDRQPGNPIRR